MPELSTRDLILREALICFSDQGFEGTSLNDIAAGVGIKRPSLLHYFATKDAIYRSIIEEALLDWGTRLDETVTTDGDGWERVDAVLLTSFEFMKRNPRVIRIVRREAMTEHSDLGIDLGAALRPFYERAVAFFRREMDRGVFREHDEENLVITGYGALLTYFSDYRMLTGLLGTDPYTDAALDARLQHMKSFIRSALEPESD